MDKVIAIGGVGGSGTRVVAEILERLDIYMGDWLKPTKDNLAFTALLRDPTLKVHDKHGELLRRIELFIKYMNHNRLSLLEAIDFHSAVKENAYYRTKKSDFFYPFSKVISSKSERKVWGWKEPNTHFFIDELFTLIPNLKYIHVLRHGLDMAFSNNSLQLKNWGHLFDLSYSGNEKPDELAYKKLEFWIRSTDLYQKKSLQFTGSTFIFNHNNFCTDSKQTIKNVCDFCGFNLTDRNKHRLLSLVSKTDSNGRYMNYDIGIFDREQVDFVRDMGFQV